MYDCDSRGDGNSRFLTGPSAQFGMTKACGLGAVRNDRFFVGTTSKAFTTEDTEEHGVTQL
jgi:hypothetical protein